MPVAVFDEYHIAQTIRDKSLGIPGGSFQIGFIEVGRPNVNAISIIPNGLTGDRIKRRKPDKYPH